MPADARFCSFCGLAQKDARKMVAGSGVNVCDRCLALASEVVLEDAPKANDRVVLSLVSDAAAR
jgi:ATP-dependent protease Clp ATPase subunit